MALVKRTGTESIVFFKAKAATHVATGALVNKTVETTKAIATEPVKFPTRLRLNKRHVLDRVRELFGCVRNGSV